MQKTLCVVILCKYGFDAPNIYQFAMTIWGIIICQITSVAEDKYRPPTMLREGDVFTGVW